MTPTKYNTLFKNVSLKTGYDEKLVEDLVEYYWSELKKAMLEGRSHNFYVSSFGTFSIKLHKIDKTIEKYKGMISNINPTTFQRKQVIEELKKRIEILEKFKASRQKELDRWEIVKNKRYGKKLDDNI